MSKADSPINQNGGGNDQNQESRLPSPHCCFGKFRYYDYWFDFMIYVDGRKLKDFSQNLLKALVQLRMRITFATLTS